MEQFKEELIAEEAAKPAKKTAPKKQKPVVEEAPVEAQTTEEEWVELYVDYIEGDAPTQFISITNDVMDRDFLLKKGELMKVPRCVAEVYWQMKKAQQEARANQANFINKEIASF